MNALQPQPDIAPAIIHPRPRKNFLVFLVLTMVILIPLESLAGTDNDTVSNSIYETLNNVDTEVSTPSPMT